MLCAPTRPLLRFLTTLGAQVDKAEQDKQSAIIKAQGEATSARLIGEAIQQNPAFITLRKIEAARDIAGTISGAANKVFLSSDSLLLNLVSTWLAFAFAIRKMPSVAFLSSKLHGFQGLWCSCRVIWMF